MTLSDNPIGASYLYLLEPEIRFLEAAVEHLIPTDELGPGARDAGVVVYIDRQLASTWGVHGRMYRGGPWMEGTPQQGYQSRFTPQEVYRIAIREIDQHCKAAFGRPFAQLAGDGQLRLLEQIGEGRDRVAFAVIEILLRSAVAQHRRGVFRGSAVRRQPRQGGLEIARIPRTCPVANTADWSPAASRTTPNPSACSTSRPARCRSTRKAFRNT